MRLWGIKVSIARSAWTRSGRTVDVDGPYGAVVAVVRAKALAVVGEPDVDDVVLRAREKQVAFLVVPELCY
jgi:uncharacterized linocin/CFP29 family protein